jgi:hypothetical protein
MGNAYVLVSAPDEASAIDSVWDGDEWQPIANINSAQVFGDGDTTVEAMRGLQGQYQSRFTDMDVRMSRATVTVALV